MCSRSSVQYENAEDHLGPLLTTSNLFFGVGGTQPDPAEAGSIVFIVGFRIQIRSTLPGGGFYLHKPLAWPGFGFFLHKLSAGEGDAFLDNGDPPNEL